jgi:uncharacterized protein
MSRENVEIMRRGWDAFNRGDTAAALDVYAADVEFDVSRDIWGDLVGGGRYYGIEGLLSWLRDLYEAWETFEMTFEELIDAGENQVITVVAARGRGRTSGVEVEHHPAGIGTLREGKVVRLVWYPSRAEALEAVGLSE